MKTINLLITTDDVKLYTSVVEELHLLFHSCLSVYCVLRRVTVFICQSTKHTTVELLNDFVCYCREISDFKVGGCKVAKLFAKHFKVSISLLIEHYLLNTACVILFLEGLLHRCVKLMSFCSSCYALHFS